MQFQSTLPLRGATLQFLLICQIIRISIHAPLTGSDDHSNFHSHGHSDFNPRSPYGERRKVFSPYGISYEFQSTLPLRGATRSIWGTGPATQISIHAPLTGSDLARAMVVVLSPPISIHAPLTGSDSAYSPGVSMVFNFNPRSPYGERLAPDTQFYCHDRISIHAPLTGSDPENTDTATQEEISIHAPLTGSDSALSEYRRVMLYFNPRSPSGERLRSRNW